MTASDNDWLREGDFYSLIDAGAYEWTRQVCFYHVTQDSLPIKSINVGYNSNGYLELTFYLSPLYDWQIYNLAKKTFTHVVNEFDDSNHQPRFSIKCYRTASQQLDPNFANQLLVFKNEHKEMKAQLTDNIMQEFDNIIRFLNNNDAVNIAHSIPTSTNAEDSYLNPTLKNSKELVSLFAYGQDIKNTVVLRKKIHTGLTKGENPNQRDRCGHSVLALAICFMHGEELIGVIKLLLVYGARYRLPDGMGLSALERSISYKNLTAFNLFSATETRLQRPMSLGVKLLTADILAGHHKVFSTYRFTQPDFEVYTTLKFSHAITSEEKGGLYQLYRKWFEGEEALQATFAPKKNKYIEILRDSSGRIIGFVTYALTIADGILTCNVDLALIDEPYNKYGFIQALIYRFPFSLQKIFPHLVIWVVFISMHKNAFHTIAKLKNLPWPMFQPDGQMDKIAHALINQFGYQLKIHYAPPDICYAIEKHPVVVKKEHASKLPNLEEELFQGFRDDKGEKNPEEIKKRGVVSAVPVSKELFEHFFSMFAALGWNFGIEVLELTDKLAESGIFQIPTPDKKLSLLYAAPLVWLNEKVAASINCKKLAQQVPYRKNIKPRG